LVEVKQEKKDDEGDEDRSFDFNDLYADTSAQPVRKEKLEIKQEVSGMDEAAAGGGDEAAEVKTEVKKEPEEEDTFIMPTAIDPKLIDSMDPDTIRKMLAGQAVSKYVLIDRFMKMLLITGKCSIITRDAPDIRPDNPAFFYIRYSAGYRVVLPDIR
jgi:hypothetical protein